MSSIPATQKRVPKIKAPPEWGIDPVPKSHRILGLLDYAVLWGDLGIGLLVMLAGTFLVPGLSLGPALLAILVGTALGCILLALVGVIGSDTGVPTMVLLRPVLGERGSWVPTALNALQLLGWTIFEFVIMGVAADAIGKNLFGASHYASWTVLFAIVVILMALGGPVGFVRHWLEKFAVWIALGTGIWLSWHLLATYDFAAQWKKAGDGSLPFWVAVDIVIALPISWLPLVADYNRFAKKSSRAFWGTLLGFFATSLWFLAMGATLMLGAGVSQDPRDFATAFALIAGWGALLVIVADETHNAWADLYSAAVSMQNIFPKAKQRALIVGLGIVALVVAAALDITRYQNFLFLIGSFFIPLFGILVADYFILRRRSYPELASPASGGRLGTGAARRPAVNPRGVIVWALGVAAYHVANPATLAAFFPKWQSAVPAFLTSLGGSIPSFALAFLLWLVFGALAPKSQTRDASSRDTHAGPSAAKGS
ncbi:MAG TPA: putative hydroxymethylpyrimidine transporter CytX [Rectinemataceae bacterium]|nr:putative hydroxymethylpyrimidine transporter CytX [Rectinemataceae bacterium]